MQNSTGSKKYNPGIFLAAWAASWTGANIFLDTQWLCLVISFPCGLLLCFAAIRLMKAKKRQHALEQLKWLLDHLSSRITAGMTLEKAFSECSSALNILIGEKTDLMKCLKRIEMHLASNRPLEHILSDLGRVFACREASLCLDSLLPLRKAGGNLASYIRKQQVMLSEQIALRLELLTEAAQRKTEALIMALMPFIMVMMFKQSTSFYRQDQTFLEIGSAGMLAAYLLSILAAVIVLLLMGRQDQTAVKRQKPFVRNRAIRQPLIVKFGFLINRLYQFVLPESYYARLIQILVDQARTSSIEEIQWVNNYFSAKAICAVAGLLPGVTMTLIEPTSFYCLVFLPAFFAFIHDQQLIRIYTRQHEEEQVAYPEFLNLVLVLLQCGLSLHKTLEISSKRYLDYGKSFVLNEKLSDLIRKISVGIPAGKALSDLSVNCSNPKIQSALLMIERYDRDGGSENLHLLQMQLNDCWSNYRQAVRRRLERHALLLYLPMALDLVAIIMTAMIPAIQTLNSI